MINIKMMKRLSAFALSALLFVSACPSNEFFATEAAEISVENTEANEQNTLVVSEVGTDTLTDETIIPNDETGIPDTVLYNYLLNVKPVSGEDAIADANGDGKLSVGEAKQIKSLFLDGLDRDEVRVRSFKNISKYIPNLTSFVCYESSMGNSTTLSTADMEEFAKLQEKNGGFSLRLMLVRFENPADIAKLNTLQELDITYSNITNLDFVTKENFPNLNYINVEGNEIEKLPVSIGEMTDLRSLNVSNNELKELPDLSALTNLDYLNVGANQLTSLSDLTALSKIKADSGNFGGNFLSEAELKAKLPAQFTDEIIKKIVEQQELDIKLADVTVSNSNVVVNNDTPTADVNVSIAVEGAGVEELSNGETGTAYLLNVENKEEFRFGVSYNAETKKFEGTVNLYGSNWSDGQYIMVRMECFGKNDFIDIAGGKEIPLWTYTNNCTDKTAPVLNGIQILINGQTQTSTTFKLKQGDTIVIRADVTDDSSLTGNAYIIPLDSEDFTSSQREEMSAAGKYDYPMYTTEYDLECEKTLNAPFYEGEYILNVVSIQDGCANESSYVNTEIRDEIAPHIKVVAKNPANVGLVENKTLITDLNKVAGNMETFVNKDGAMDATTKAEVEAAIAAGDTISADLTISNVPTSSVNSKVREDAQKKADGVFGENTKLVYLDINMNLVGAKTGSLGTLKELGEEIDITVTIPEELQGDYEYKVVRSHEKADDTIEITILDAVKNTDNTLTFKTDRFSIYAIAYGTIVPKQPEEEPEKQPEEEPEKQPEEEPEKQPEEEPEKQPEELPTIPQTGDKSMTLMYFGLAVIGMTALVVFRKNRKA